MGICAAKIADHKLEMELIDVEYTFDNNKIFFYFTADGRVDFRDQVKDLASVFRTRIEIRQIGSGRGKNDGGPRRLRAPSLLLLVPGGISAGLHQMARSSTCLDPIKYREPAAG
jgi:hypothetical protein